jgi:predicted NAD/FAD-dependent oxidoreductase
MVIEADALIVGAGMAGLSAAQKLRANGARAIVLEKEQKLGGRLATWQMGGGRADYGAQFFTTRTTDFRAAVDQWLAIGLVYEWSRGWSDGSLAPPADDGYPRYAVKGGFRELMEYIAADLDVRLGRPIAAVELAGNGWVVADQARQRYAASAVLLTPPVPQSLALLDASGVQLAADDRHVLEQIDYAPCLCGLFLVDGEVHLPEPGALQQPGAAISWIADNQHKGISPEARIITVHAGELLSRELWEKESPIVLQHLQAALVPFLGRPAIIREAQLKRWRYATPTTIHPQCCLVAQNLPPLVFAGDAFGGPRVEGAALSGWAAAAMSKELLQRTYG